MEEKKDTNTAPTPKADEPAKDTKKKKGQEDELSEEDQRIKEELELLVTRVQDEDEGVQKFALESMSNEIKTSTTSMTAIPKPLKFLRPHYTGLKTYFLTMKEGANKRALADVLSILAMTMAEEGSCESLTYKLQGNSTDIGSWGHEYARSLAGEIGTVYLKRKEEEKPFDDLMTLVDKILPFYMQHNVEYDACDLLMEVEKLDKLLEYVDEANYERVCSYLMSSADYVAEPEDIPLLRVALQIYQKLNKQPAALQVAIRLNDMDTITFVYQSCQDPLIKKQLAFILARQGLFLDEDDPDYSAIMNNSNRSEYFLALARDLDVLDPKTPDDIYKSSATDNRASSLGTNVDSARQNLSATFVNGFVNAAFGTDKLMTDEQAKWIYKNKEHGMLSAVASLGMILLWDVDGGLMQIDKYLYSQEDYIKAGALLATGIVNSGVKHECDPALAFLVDKIEDVKAPAIMRQASVLGLGIAYAGSNREDLLSILTPVLEDSTTSIELNAIAALALGLIFVGSSHAEVTQSILAVLLERDETSLKNTIARLLPVGLGLVYLGKQELAEVPVETVRALPGEVGKYAALTVETCAYAGTGNVLKIQELLKVCGEHREKEKEAEGAHQGAAVLGIALVAMAEDLGKQMAVRTMDHLLQYGDPPVRRAVPLALGLLYVGHPIVGVMDTLSKLSHDQDADVVSSAILALGLIGAGTNNSRAAKLLRNLASYYVKDANQLFVVRLAQGLLHMGKGTLSLVPYSAQGCLHRVAAAGLITVLHLALDVKNTYLNKWHYLLYTVVCAIQPRMLMTFDEELKPLGVSVRVGQAVDVVGQAGHPKTITGAQTHTTPVLIAYGDRAELTTDEYIPLSNNLDGFVILRKNPEYVGPLDLKQTKK
eukprot:TRINITY_DN216_c0_g1_i1.p1 TRINITY_DN216_c0_g1~~TRINITY_DN216_c0_g1_i1.p1  ORF type:complete len:904 (+),score=160.99 TRINITY_DN216_c0_g1_i1:66-2714(+)